MEYDISDRDVAIKWKNKEYFFGNTLKGKLFDILKAELPVVLWVPNQAATLRIEFFQARKSFMNKRLAKALTLKARMY